MPAPQPAAEHHSHHQGEQSALDEELKDVLGLGEVLGAASDIGRVSRCNSRTHGKRLYSMIRS